MEKTLKILKSNHYGSKYVWWHQQRQAMEPKEKLQPQHQSKHEADQTACAGKPSCQRYRSARYYLRGTSGGGEMLTAHPQLLVYFHWQGLRKKQNQEKQNGSSSCTSQFTFPEKDRLIKQRVPELRWTLLNKATDNWPEVKCLSTVWAT